MTDNEENRIDSSNLCKIRQQISVREHVLFTSRLDRNAVTFYMRDRKFQSFRIMQKVQAINLSEKMRNVNAQNELSKTNFSYETRPGFVN